MEEGSKNQKDESRARFSLVAFIIAATVFSIFLPIGYNIGEINTPAKFIKEWINQTVIYRYKSTLTQNDMELLWAFVVSIFLIGATLSSLVGSWIANRFGRKSGIFVSAALFIVGGVFCVICKPIDSIEILIVGRLVTGFGAGMSTAIGPMYLAEVAPLNLRGPAGTCIGVGICFGIFIGQLFSLQQLLGGMGQWEYSQGVFVIFVVIFILPFAWFPESPKYLYVTLGDKEKAKQVLIQLRGLNSPLIEQELVMMEDERRMECEIQSVWSVIRNGKLLLPVVLIIVISMCMQLSGLNAVIMYSVSIFDATGLNAEDAQWAALSVAAINFCITGMSPLVMATFNRRPLLIYSSLFTGITLSLLLIIIYFIDYADWLPFASIAMIVCFILSLQVGLGPIAYFIGSQLFQSASRPAGMALGSLSAWAGAIIVGMAFPIMQLAWKAFAFLPFVISTFVVTTFLLFYMPETRGRTVTDVAASIENGFKSIAFRKPVK